jgi:CheY-like chemotaxis protein
LQSSVCVAERVLIVDDDGVVRDGMERIFKRAGFAPITAPNGRVALELLRTGTPTKVIVLDLMMPEMDGWMFRREQLRDPRLAHIPVIVLSALSGAWVEGVPPTLGKPVDVQQLLSQVRELIDTHNLAI